MIYEHDPAYPTGVYGQQVTPGKTILMEYAGMFMAGMVNNTYTVEYRAHIAVAMARALIKELNKEMVTTKPVLQHGHLTTK